MGFSIFNPLDCLFRVRSDLFVATAPLVDGFEVTVAFLRFLGTFLSISSCRLSSGNLAKYAWKSSWYCS